MNERQPVERKEDTGLAASVARIAGIISSDNFPTGDRAVLRRMAPGQAEPLLFTRFAFRTLPPGWERRREAWATIVAGIAVMAPAAHHPSRGLGQALAENGYSEVRLERLLAAVGEIRMTLLLRAVRFLASKSASFNWTDAARLLLTEDDGLLEKVHHRIARDYFQNLKTETA